MGLNECSVVSGRATCQKIPLYCNSSSLLLDYQIRGYALFQSTSRSSRFNSVYVLSAIRLRQRSEWFVGSIFVCFSGPHQLYPIIWKWFVLLPLALLDRLMIAYNGHFPDFFMSVSNWVAVYGTNSCKKYQGGWGE